MLIFLICLLHVSWSVRWMIPLIRFIIWFEVRRKITGRGWNGRKKENTKNQPSSIQAYKKGLFVNNKLSLKPHPVYISYLESCKYFVFFRSSHLFFYVSKFLISVALLLLCVCVLSMKGFLPSAFSSELK